MIRPLRSVHRGAFLSLALLLPAVLLGAWRVRRPPPTRALAPELLSGEASSAGDELVYWSTTAAGSVGELPADAELVGTVRSGALARRPPDGRRVLVVDLAHGSVRTAENAP